MSELCHTQPYSLCLLSGDEGQEMDFHSRGRRGFGPMTVFVCDIHEEVQLTPSPDPEPKRERVLLPLPLSFPCPHYRVKWQSRKCPSPSEASSHGGRCRVWGLTGEMSKELVRSLGSAAPITSEGGAQPDPQLSIHL